MKKLSILFLFFSLSFMSCQMDKMKCYVNKDGFIKAHSKLVEKGLKEDWEADSPKWEKFDKEFERMVEECYEHYSSDFTLKETKDFWFNNIKYGVKRSASDCCKVNLKESYDRNADEIARNFEDFEQSFDEFDQEINKILDQIDTEKLNKVLKDIGNDVEKYAEKFKEIFKDVDFNLEE